MIWGHIGIYRPYPSRVGAYIRHFFSFLKDERLMTAMAMEGSQNRGTVGKRHVCICTYNARDVCDLQTAVVASGATLGETGPIGVNRSG